jgi:hypothetical protein
MVAEYLNFVAKIHRMPEYPLAVPQLPWHRTLLPPIHRSAVLCHWI